MRLFTTTTIIAAVGLGFMATARQAYGQTVYHIPNGVIADMSDDGSVGLGYATNEGDRSSRAWTVGAGGGTTVNRWGQDPTIPGTRNEGYAISGDGSTYFGFANDFVSPSTAGMFRYRGPGTYQYIANPSPNYWTILNRSSRDGNAAVGYAYNYNVPFAAHVAVRWTAQTGVVAVGITNNESEAADISSDGNTIVGYGSPGWIPTAWVWTAADGTRRLADLPGSGGSGSQAIAVTGDGTVIAGTSGGAGGEAVVWRQGIIESLGRIDGYLHGRATSISDDASIIVGDMYDHVHGQGNVGFVWTRERGMELSADFFARMGVVLPTGYAQSSKWRVSADGQSLYVRGPDAFIVRIPSPATLALLTALIPLSARRRRN